ncbi:MAG: energy transducer TonB [Saprospiraceae bacterium]|nr:energy transducer TonB [Saprospiraceae bacterium]
MDFSSLNFTGSTIAVIIALVVIGIIAFIFLRKRQMENQSPGGLADLHSSKGDAARLANRNKYPEADVFRSRGTYLNLGVALSLLFIVLAFNWTEYEDDVFIPEDALVLPDEIEMEPPRTAEPPPPPPPPPPPVIEEVPDEEIDEEDEPEFVDNSVTEEQVVEKPIEAPKPPPPPPPPPPPKVEEIFKVVEDMPRFPGCESEGDKAAKDQCATKKMLEYIYKNIKYPAIARENGVEGTVVVQFVVEKDGSITASKVVRDIGAGCGDEAQRIVDMMPKWIPGRQRGNAVRVQFNLPVRFKLE